MNHNRNNYDAFIARLYKYGSFIAIDNWIRLCLRCGNHITYLHMIYIGKRDFSLELVEFDEKILDIEPFLCDDITSLIFMLSKYIGTNIYEPYEIHKIIQD